MRFVFVLIINVIYRTLLEGVWLGGLGFVRIAIQIPFPLSHTPSSNVRYIAFSMSFNENKLRTHTLQSKVRYFHVTPKC